MHTCYVYWFVDSTTGDCFYVGKSHDRVGYNRIYEHQYMATRMKHYNKPLQARLRKGNYDTVKVAEHLSEEAAFTLEASHISQFGLKLSGGQLLNLVDGTIRGGYCWTQQRRDDKRASELRKNKGIPVTQYTMFGQVIQTFHSAKVAAEQTSANRSYITQVCQGKRRSAGGFQWKYASDNTVSSAYQTIRGRTITQRTLAGELVQTFTSCKFIREAGFNFRNVLDCCKGKSKTSQGFVWAYVE